jgi:hypothetical protein
MPSIGPKVHVVAIRKGGPECIGHVLWEVLNDCTHRGRHETGIEGQQPERANPKSQALS